MSHADRLTRDGKSRTGRQPWMLAAYTSLGLALLAVLGIAGWGATVDFEETRLSLLQEKVNGLRTHAVRSALRVHELASRDGKSIDIALPEVKKWLHEQWDRSIKHDPSRLYAALVDDRGRVVAHYFRKLEDGVLDTSGGHRKSSIAGDDVFETDDPRLTGGAKALDVEIPIRHEDRLIGVYHSGFNVNWFEKELAIRRRDTMTRWGIAFAVISLVVLLAGFSLFQIARRLYTLQGAVTSGQVRRLVDLGQLAGGIAHEIRNPLNAIRLNLHVIRKLSDARPDGPLDDMGVIEETVREIERVDGLLKTMLDYARPEQARQEIIDTKAEVESVVRFLNPLLHRDLIAFNSDFGSEPLPTKIDRGRFRQVVLNLLKNAMEAVGREGSVAVKLRRIDDSIQFTVIDSGPGLPAEGADLIFEPFFSTKELGTGLGLTLVKRYVEEAGGTVSARAGQTRGAVFEVMLPRVESHTIDTVTKPARETTFAAT
jgi:signal transduction histidine kinase